MDKVISDKFDYKGTILYVKAGHDPFTGWIIRIMSEDAEQVNEKVDLVSTESIQDALATGEYADEEEMVRERMNQAKCKFMDRQVVQRAYIFIIETRL